MYRIIIYALLSVSVLVGCVGVPASGAAVSSVEITKSPPDGTLGEKASFQFAAKASDENEKPLSGVKLVWSSIPPEAGSITSSGRFTANCYRGEATVTVAVAANLDINDSVTFDIVPGAAASVSVSPLSTVVTVGDTVEYSAEVKDICIVVVEDPPLVWSRTNTKAGVIDPETGFFTAGQIPGKYSNTVIATSGAKKGKATVVVKPEPPELVKLFIGSRYLGEEIEIAAGTKGTIKAKAYTDSEGLNETKILKFQFDLDGDAFIPSSVTSGSFSAVTLAGKTGTITVQPVFYGEPVGDPWEFPVTIVHGPAKNIIVTPNSEQVEVGETVEYSAAVTDTYGNPIEDAEIAWSVSPSKGGAFDPNPGDSTIFTAGTFLGKYTVTASSGKAKGKATLTIMPVPPSEVRLFVNPNVDPLTTEDTYEAVAGKTVTVKAKGYDEGDNELTYLKFTYGKEEDIGTVNSSSGAYAADCEAGNEGFIIVQPTYAGANPGDPWKFPVTIVHGPVKTVTVSPSPCTLSMGQIQQFTAEAKDQCNNVIVKEDAPIIWSTACSGSKISETGEFEAGETPGKCTVKACSGSICGTASVTILAETCGEHIQMLLSDDDWDEVDITAEHAWFSAYHAQNPNDPCGVFGYAITRVAAMAKQLADKYGTDDEEITKATSFHNALALVTGGDVAKAKDCGLDLILGRNTLPQSKSGGAKIAGANAIGIQSEDFTPAELAADVKNVLIPAIQDAISHLSQLISGSTPPSWPWSYTSPEFGEFHVREQEARSYRAALEMILGTAATAAAYNWNDGGFDWNRTCQQMDANHDGLLVPSEYLPGGSCGTLTTPSLLTTGWNALNDALEDAGAVADSLLTSQDPLQLLAMGGDPVNWLEIYTAVEGAQRALAGPTVVSYPFEFWEPCQEREMTVQIPLTTNLRAFWTNPISNLRSLAPTYKIYSGDCVYLRLNPNGIPDRTLHGILPNAETEMNRLIWEKWFGRECGGSGCEPPPIISVIVYVTDEYQETVVPTKTATIYTGQSLDLGAVVLGRECGAAVTWSVTGGSKEELGENKCRYTAPETAGTYLVTATWVGNPLVTGVATITVIAQPVSDALEHLNELIQADDWENIDIAEEYQGWEDYHTAHPNDDIATFGYTLAMIGKTVKELMDEYDLTGEGEITATTFRSALKTVASGDIAKIKDTAFDMITGRRMLEQNANTKAESFAFSPMAVHTQAYTPEDMAKDIRDVLIPVLQDAIGHLSPLVARTDVIVSYTDLHGHAWHIRAEEIRAYRAALEAVVGVLGTVTAYSCDDGGFDWNKTPQAMDADHDGFLTPAEYLPGGDFATLTHPEMMTTGGNALNAALADVAAVANALLTSQDPLQFLAIIQSEGAVDWLTVYAAAQTAQRALAGPVIISYNYTDEGAEEDTAANITVDLRKFWTDPISDLRSIAPTYEIVEYWWGRICMEVDSVPDETLHGILPNGDEEVPDELWQEWFNRCDGPDEPNFNIWIDPNYTSVDSGFTYQFQINVYDGEGNEVNDADVVWSVTNETAGAIDQNGRFTASNSGGYYPNVIKAVVTLNEHDIGTCYASVFVDAGPPPP